MTSSAKQYTYDVALSYSGEDRNYADALAEALRHRKLNVFYDKYEKSTLWGKNLYTYLSDVYQNKARYCVMFLSQHYAAKLWTNHEREAAQARAFSENEEYILPVRLDNTVIPGIPPTVAYLSWPPETAETIADAIVEKMGNEVITRELEGKAPRPEIHSPDQKEGDVADIPFFPNLAANEVSAIPSASTILFPPSNTFALPPHSVSSQPSCEFSFSEAPPILSETISPMQAQPPLNPPFQRNSLTATEPARGRAPAVVALPQRPPLANRRLLLVVLVLLVALSGSGLIYFTVLAPRPLVLTPAQATVATATAHAHASTATVTADAQAYAAAIARQGVMFGFNAAHTHFNPYEHTLGPGTVAQLTTLWSFAFKNSRPHSDVDFSSSPVVAGGAVYVGSANSEFYAFDATCRSKCQPLWSYNTGDVIVSSPAVAGGLVYVGSYDGKLYAFDATCRSKCQPLWSYNTGEYIVSSPVVAGGLVYVGSANSRFYAFDATCRSKCQPLWSYNTGEYIVSSPAVAGGLVYVISANSRFYAFDATCRSKCQPLWSYSAANFICCVDVSSPVVAGGMVYVGSGHRSEDGKLYAFDAACRSKCQPLQSFSIGNDLLSSPVVAEGLIYVGSGNGYVYALGLPT